MPSGVWTRSKAGFALVISDERKRTFSSLQFGASTNFGQSSRASLAAFIGRRSISVRSPRSSSSSSNSVGRRDSVAGGADAADLRASQGHVFWSIAAMRERTHSNSRKKQVLAVQHLSMSMRERFHTLMRRSEEEPSDLIYRQLLRLRDTMVMIDALSAEDKETLWQLNEFIDVLQERRAQQRTFDSDQESVALPQSAQENPAKRYRIVRTLRDTLQGKLVFAIDRDSGTQVAIKVCSKEAIARHESMSGDQVLEDPLNEARLLQQLNTPGHPHVISLLQTFEDSFDCWMVLEFAERGEFFDIVCEAGRLDESVSRLYFRHLIDALFYIHSRHICHLDLSLENILMDASGSLKLCDFGLARLFSDEPFEPAEKTKPGKTCYMAPEIFDGRSFHGPAADIYSAGVILFILIFGCPPYEIPSLSDQRFRLIYSGRLSDLLQRWRVSHLSSALLVDLLSRLLCSPADRLALEDVRDHPWLSEHTDDKEEEV